MVTLAAEVVEEDMVMVAEEEEEDMVTVEEVVDLMAVDMVNKVEGLRDLKLEQLDQFLKGKCNIYHI